MFQFMVNYASMSEERLSSKNITVGVNRRIRLKVDMLWWSRGCLDPNVLSATAADILGRMLSSINSDSFSLIYYQKSSTVYHYSFGCSDVNFYINNVFKDSEMISNLKKVVYISIRHRKLRRFVPELSLYVFRLIFKKYWNVKKHF